MAIGTATAKARYHNRRATPLSSLNNTSPTAGRACDAHLAFRRILLPTQQLQRCISLSSLPSNNVRHLFQLSSGNNSLVARVYLQQVNSFPPPTSFHRSSLEFEQWAFLQLSPTDMFSPRQPLRFPSMQSK